MGAGGILQSGGMMAKTLRTGGSGVVNGKPISVFVHGTPRAKQSFMVTGRGRGITPLATREWQKSVFDFYTFEGSLALRNKLRNWEGGQLVVHITAMPIKCAVAPLEFSFLADSYFKNKKMRDKVEITYVTPLSGAFTKPKATETLDHLLHDKTSIN